MSIDIYDFFDFFWGKNMGKYKNKAYPLRLDNELMEKVRKIAEIEDRKISNQLERIIRQYVENYESQHGNINIGDVTITGNTGNISIGSNNK